jgi:hypothetical protein
LLDNRPTLANNATVLLPHPCQKSAFLVAIRGENSLQCDLTPAASGVVILETRDVAFPFFDGATSASGLGPPDCSISELLTKPETSDIGSFRRKLTCAWPNPYEEKPTQRPVCPHTEAEQEFFI